MMGKMRQYRCPKCGQGGAHPTDMKPPLCHSKTCDYKTEMLPSQNGVIISDNKNELITKYSIGEYKEECVHDIDLSSLTGIVLVVGSSGSGKSTLLDKTFGKQLVEFDNSIMMIDNFSSPEKAEQLLIASGFRSIPAWFRPFNTLSNGERHRAEIALSLDREFNVIDEFTSVVDRDTAKSLSVAINKYYKSSNQSKPLFLASCHYDIAEWLCPDYIYNTDTKKLSTKEFLRRPDITLSIQSTTFESWEFFKKHHYLDTTMSSSCHCFIASLNEKPVAFLSIIHGTGRDIKSYWRESRIVVIPEFQGLGIGKALSNTIAEYYTSLNMRYFSKTAHPALGEHRNSSPEWRGTANNMKRRTSYIMADGSARTHKGHGKTPENIIRDAMRVCYSHEFIGNKKEIK